MDLDGQAAHGRPKNMVYGIIISGPEIGFITFAPIAFAAVSKISSAATNGISSSSLKRLNVARWTASRDLKPNVFPRSLTRTSASLSTALPIFF